MKSAPDQYKTQEICDKAVNNYAHVLGFAPNYHKITKMCNKTVNTYPSIIQSTS